MGKRHSTAIIHSGAKLADDVEIGPYSIIGEHVEIGAGSVVGPHVVINGHTTIGTGNRIFQFSSIGEIPQDKKYRGEPTRLVIGDNNTIRECCTLNLGTAQDKGIFNGTPVVPSAAPNGHKSTGRVERARGGI